MPERGGRCCGTGLGAERWVLTDGRHSVWYTIKDFPRVTSIPRFDFPKQRKGDSHEAPYQQTHFREK